jgi:hypothetical protein
MDIFKVWKRGGRRIVADWCLSDTGIFIVVTMLLLFLFLFLLAPLCWVFTITYLKQTMFLRCTVLHLFGIYNLCYL